MASRWKLGMGFVKFENAQYGEESSESENETEPAKTFIRKLSTNAKIKSAAATKEGFLLKQTSFQRWRRRYFKLKGRKLYYAKDAKAVIFDEIEIAHANLNTLGTKNAGNNFQIITPFRRLVLAAETKREMDEWIAALKAANSKEYCEGGEHEDFLSGHHHWYATSHARPTYCNVCREPLSGVTSHGLSCEICKCKVHKKCAAKAINNCKWTTLASVGQDIIEDRFGNITMPHQWMEGNLPVSSKCAVCDKTCGSVLRLQDWRCLWCRAAVHTACRPHIPVKCPLGLAKVSVVPPTALHSIGNDEAWEAVRPQGCSPLLVFVNSKSGENQGIKFLRRFKQLLNPAQVFDLVHGGPGLGLRLFRHFDPFRILVCSGDGSVGWVLSEIDRLNMQKQCQVGVLPLGTGNDLARVLGWGASCDDDTHLPQLLDKYEKASTKMLDRWSVMTLERGVVLPRTLSKLSLDEPCITARMAEYEDNVMSHLAKIIQSDQHSVVINSARILCETVKEFTLRMAQTSLAQGDEHFSQKCQVLNTKLALLVQILEEEGGALCSEAKTEVGENDEAEKSAKEKQEKDIINLREKAAKTFVGKEALMSRANSLKKAVRQLVEYTEQAVDQQNNVLSNNDYVYKTQPTSKHSIDVPTFSKAMDTLKVMPTIESASSSEVSPCPSPHMFLSPSSCDVRNLGSCPAPSRGSSRSPSAADIRLSAISPLPDVRRESGCDEMITLPVPDQFADRRKSYPETKSEPLGASEARIGPLITIDQPETPPPTMKVFKGDLNAEKDLIEFERDVICELEKSEGPSLWETVVSSLNEDARSIVTDSRMPSRRTSHIDLGNDYNKILANNLNCDISDSKNKDVDASVNLIQGSDKTGEDNSVIFNDIIKMDDPQHRESIVSITDSACNYLLKTFNSRLDEMELSHIDSSESPSEEASPPNPSLSPPPPTDIPPKIPPSPRYIHKSFTENFLGVPNVSGITRSVTNVPGEGLLKVSFSDTDHLSCNNGTEDKRAINRRHSDIKTKKDLANEFLNNYEYIAGRDDNLDLNGLNLQPDPHPYLSRKDSRRLYTDNDIDITEDIELEPELRCSLAQFVEGNDIARMSFKRKPRRSSSKAGDLDMVQIQFKGSNGDLTKEWNEKFNADSDQKDHRLSTAYSEGDDDDEDVDDDEIIHEERLSKKESEIRAMPEFQVVINPPSPVEEMDMDLRRFSAESVGKLSAFSSYTSGLLQASPQATRRVSNCSLLKADIIQAFGDQRNRSKSFEKDAELVKKLPIINPLVRLPMWPNVSSGAGLISKVLLANADALCATAAPLMDFDETLLEGFYEKCVMNNYFGIGIDAKIALDFHHRREEHPEKCRSRAKNYMWYGVLGSREWLQKTYKNLEQRVQLECDGQRIPLPSLQGIVVLNIPSFMGGTNFWGGTKEDDCFLAPSFDDRVLEVVAVFGSVQMAASRLINLQHHRIAQCQSVQINVLGDEGVPIQVDGEAWIQPPGVIRIIHKNRMQMLCRNRELETSLKTWEEKQKLSYPHAHPHQITQESQTTTSISQSSGSVPETGFPVLLTEEESRLLLGFIEVTTTLVKCVQLVTISHPTLSKDMYELASKTSAALENVHPGGKIIEGPELRPALTRLVNSAKDLYEEACSALRNKQHNLKLREDMEGKLGGALADMEIELRKCSVDDNGTVGLHHIFEQSGHKGRGRALFWLKLRRHGNHRQREAASWGVGEVSQWLESLQLSEYVESFAKNDIRGRELLALARRDLKDLGVTKVGHVKRILQAIRDLNL